MNETVARLPRILARWKSNNGTSFASYFLSAMHNHFRHSYAKRQRRAVYNAEWPTDEEGEKIDLADTSTRLNGGGETEAARSREFESAMFRIPGELARRVEPPFGGLVHYVAERYLMRADNCEALYLSELAREVKALPAASPLTEREIDALVRMTIAGVRARLYPLRNGSLNTPRASESALGFLCDKEAGGSSAEGFLCRLSYRIWPLLLILDPAATRLLLFSLAGVHESIPPRDRWLRAGANGNGNGKEKVARANGLDDPYFSHTL